MKSEKRNPSHLHFLSTVDPVKITFSFTTLAQPIGKTETIMEEPQPEETQQVLKIGKTRIPVPNALYIQSGRSKFLEDVGQFVYRDEEAEREEKRKLLQRKRRRKRKEDYTEDDGYGPPGILHTRPAGKGKFRKRTSSELGDSSIELLGPSASLETDESDGTHDLLTESLQFDEKGERIDRESRSASGFRRYAVKKAGKEKRSDYRKSKTVGGAIDEEDFSDGDEDSGRHLLPRRREKREESKGTPGKSPRRSERAKEGKSRERRGKSLGKSPDKARASKSSKMKGEASPRREHHDPVEKVENWKQDRGKRTGGHKEKVGERRREVDGKYTEDWKREKASKPPKPNLTSVYGEGLTPQELEERKNKDFVRDTAAGMRLLQLCQSGDWYGVDGHLRYFEKRVQNGLTLNTKPLAELKDEGTGWTPLMYTIKDNRIALGDRMLEMGCDINGKTKDGFSAIHLAALYGRDETIRFLIDKQADVKALTESKKQNVLHIACSRKAAAGQTGHIMRVLLQVLSPETRLEKDEDGNIPLFIALKNGLKGACQELLTTLDKEQLSMTCGEMQDTPLHITCRKKDLELCRLLVEAGANVDAVNIRGQTPLHIGSEMGDENLCKFLYLMKANPHLADNEGKHLSLNLKRIKMHKAIKIYIIFKYFQSILQFTWQL